MKISSCIAICIMWFFTEFSSAQTWFTTRGLEKQDERAWAIATDQEGNLFWALAEKNAWPYWYYNIVLFKLDAEGKQVWQSDPWGWTFNEIAFIAVSADSVIYLGGRFDSTAALDGRGANALVMAYDALSGSYLWSYQWDQGFGYEEIDGLVIQSYGIYLTGWTKGVDSDMDFLVQKLNLKGQLLWTSTWDCDDARKFDGANGHMAMDGQFIYAAGHVKRNNIASLDGDGALVCFSRHDGAYQWHRTWGGNLYDDALGLAMSSDSMLYIVGVTGSFGSGSQIFLNKYDRNGTLQYNRLWGGSGAEDSRAIAAAGDSLIYVAGATSSYAHGEGDYDVFVLKYDANGTLIDSLLWGGAYRESVHDIALHDHYLYITGETASFGNAPTDGHHSDGLLLKIDGQTMTGPGTTPTSISEREQMQAGFNLQQNYPNPFNPSTVINFELERSAWVRLNVYNLTGQSVVELVQDYRTAGVHHIVWDGRDGSGRLQPSGVYFYQLEVDSPHPASHRISVKKKMTFLH